MWGWGVNKLQTVSTRSSENPMSEMLRGRDCNSEALIITSVGEHSCTRVLVILQQNPVNLLCGCRVPRAGELHAMFCTRHARSAAACTDQPQRR